MSCASVSFTPDNLTPSPRMCNLVIMYVYIYKAHLSLLTKAII